MTNLRKDDYTILVKEAPYFISSCSGRRAFRCLELPGRTGGRTAEKNTVPSVPSIMWSSWNGSATVFGVKERDTAVHLPVQLSS